MFLEKLTKPVVLLCVAGGALLVALVVLYVVTRDLYPRVAACEAKVQPCAEPCPASLPPAAEPGIDGGQEGLTVNGAESMADPVTPPAQKNGTTAAAAAATAASGHNQTPCARRRGGMVMPGALTRRSRVQISEFTPALTMASTGDDAPPPGPDKVVVRRITGAPPSVIEDESDDQLDDADMEDGNEDQ